MTISSPVRSKCCEAFVRAGYRKAKNSNLRVQIWVCLNCKKKDCDVVPFVNGKIVKQVRFASEEDEDSTLDTDEPFGL